MADHDWHSARRREDRMDREDWLRDEYRQYGRRNRVYPPLAYGPFGHREGAEHRTDSRRLWRDEDTGSFGGYGQGSLHGRSPRNRYDYRGAGPRHYGGRTLDRYDPDNDRTYYGAGPAHTARDWRGYGDYDRDGDRNWIDRTGDEIASWFGDEEAEYRRRRDRYRDDRDRYLSRDDHHEPHSYGAQRWRDDW